MAKFGNGEKVLCFHGPLMYDAKCMNSTITEDNSISYLVHYEGWKRSWDEWVPESRLFKYNKNNLVIQQELLRIHTENAVKIEKENSIANDDTGSNENDEETDENDEETNENDKGPNDSDVSEEMCENEEEFSCTKCDITFNDQSDHDRHWMWHILQLEHMQSCHVKLKEEKVYTCELCTRCSLYKDEMEEHQKYCKRKEVPENNNIIPEDLEIKTSESITESDIEVEISTTLDRPGSPSVQALEVFKTSQSITESDGEMEITTTLDRPGPLTVQDLEVFKTSQSITERDFDVELSTNMDISGPKSMESMNDLVDEENDNKMAIEIEISETIINNAEESNIRQQYSSAEIFLKIEPKLLLKWEPKQLKHMQSSYIELKHVKIFKCLYCDNVYPDRETLKTHEKKYFETNISRPQDLIDDGIERPFVCDTCGWCFVRKSTLRAHMVLHQPFPHLCECGIGYYLFDDLQAHRKLVHPDFKSLPPLPSPPSSVLSKSRKSTSKKLKTKPKSKSTTQKETKNKPSNNKIGPKLKSTLTLKKPINKPNKYVKEIQVTKQPSVHSETGIEAKALKRKKTTEETHVNGEIKKETEKPRPKRKRRKEAEILNNESTTPDVNGEINKTGKTLRFKSETNKATIAPRVKTEKDATKTPQKKKTTKTPQYKNEKKKVTKTPRVNNELTKVTKKPRVKSEIRMELEADENGTYTCSLCSLVFLVGDELAVHLYTEHTTRVGNTYECNCCGKGAKSRCSLKIHMLGHAGLKGYLCPICKGRFSQTGALKLHLRRHNNIRPYPCDHCSKSFYDKRSHEVHLRTHTGEKPNECEQCGTCFNDPTALRRHLIIHTGLKPYKCDICPKEYCDNGALYRHKRFHNGYTVPCKDCDRTFASRASLLYHIKAKHKKVRDDKYECDHCGYRCARKIYLTRHITFTHMQRRPRVQCDICSKKVMPRTMERHIQDVHLKITRYKCDLCDLRFYYKSQLNAHKERTHRPITAERKYECDYCHKKVYYKHYITRHIINVHLGIQCKSCKVCFSTSAQLRRHKADGCRRCPECDKAFRSRVNLNEHRSIVHEDKSKPVVYQCEYCTKSYLWKSSFQKHVKCHSLPTGGFHCAHCSKTTSSKKAIRTHIWEQHMATFNCHICLKTFYNETEYRRHIRKTKCRPLVLACDKCERIFHNRSIYQAHLFQHVLVRRWLECNTCGIIIKLKRQMIGHIRDHKDQSTERVVEKSPEDSRPVTPVLHHANKTSQVVVHSD